MYYRNALAFKRIASHNNKTPTGPFTHSNVPNAPSFVGGQHAEEIFSQIHTAFKDLIKQPFSPRESMEVRFMRGTSVSSPRLYYDELTLFQRRLQISSPIYAP